MYIFLFSYTLKTVTYHCVLDLIQDYKYIVILMELLKFYFLCWTAYLWYVVFHLFCPVKCLEENRNSYMVTVIKRFIKFKLLMW